MMMRGPDSWKDRSFSTENFQFFPFHMCLISETKQSFCQTKPELRCFGFQ